MHTRAARVFRGALAATVATFAALFSHVVAGGEMPGWLGIVAPWIFSTMICTLLAGRRLSAVRLTIGVAASQVLFHTLFVLGATGSGAAMNHHGHGMSMAGLPVAAAGAVAHADAVMWLWHAAAAVVTAAVLHRGEHAARRLLDLAAQATGWLRRRLQTPVLIPARPVARIVGVHARRPLFSLAALTPLVRRGPPHALVL